MNKLIPAIVKILNDAQRAMTLDEIVTALEGKRIPVGRGGKTPPDTIIYQAIYGYLNEVEEEDQLITRHTARVYSIIGLEFSVPPKPVKGKQKVDWENSTCGNCKNLSFVGIQELSQFYGNCAIVESFRPYVRPKEVACEYFKQKPNSTTLAENNKRSELIQLVGAFNISVKSKGKKWIG